MEKIVEDLDILLSRMDIFAVHDENASNYKIDSLQIRALVKENSGKTDIPSCSSDEQMMDLISEKEETIEAKETYSFRPQSDKTLSFEKIIQNPIVQDPVELQILTMKELYSLPSTSIRFVDFKGVYPRINYLQDSNPDEIRYWYEFGAINSIYLTPPDFPELMLKFLSVGPYFHDEYRYPAYHFIQLVTVNDKDNNMETFRKPFHGFSREGIRVRRAIRLRIILTTMETTLKRDFRTYEGESKFPPVMIAPTKKSPSGAIMYLQQRMKMIERSIIKSSPDAQSKFCVQRSHARRGGICLAYSKNKEVTVTPDD
ncbi:hypothetical protein Tco_1493575 [Tanacetum coccineum]